MSKPGPGKFEGNVSEEVADRLYEITMDSGWDEQFGDVSEYGVWVALIDNHRIEDPLLGAAYMVTEDNNGFFTYTEYETSEEAWEAYFANLASYESWATS